MLPPAAAGFCPRRWPGPAGGCNLGEPDHQWRQVLGQAMAQRGSIGDQHAGDTGNPAGGLGGLGAAVAGDQHIDHSAELERGAECGQGGELDRGAIMFGDDENGHVRSPALRS